jgi:hypothetical protein
VTVTSGKGFVALAALVALLVLASGPAYADFELLDSAGRRIFLKSDGTWRYADGAPPSAAGADSAAASAPKRTEPEADLRITSRRDIPGGCAYELRLHNHLTVEIGSLVPDFRVYRNSDIVYTEVNVGFGRLKPGDEQTRELRIQGLACAQIVRLQVTGGDRCEIGDLNKFSDVKGLCLAKVRVLPSDVVRVEK